jgi:hypothetical protein
MEPSELTWLRTFVAFVVAPISVGIALMFLSLFGSSLEMGFLGLRFIAQVTYPLAVVLGIPLYFLMKKRRLTELFHYAAASVVFSAPIVVFFVIWPTLAQGEGFWSIFASVRIMQMIIICFASLLTTSIFWKIARPDKQDKNRRHDSR